MRALALAWLMVLTLAAVMAAGIALVAAMVVDAARGRLTWSEPGLPMHELIAPTGELQDPAYLDRRRRPAGESWARRPASHVPVPLMSRAPWTVQKGERSVRHG